MTDRSLAIGLESAMPVRSGISAAAEPDQRTQGSHIPDSPALRRLPRRRAPAGALRATAGSAGEPPHPLLESPRSPPGARLPRSDPPRLQYRNGVPVE